MGKELCPMCGQRTMVDKVEPTIKTRGRHMCSHCDQPCEDKKDCKGCKTARGWLGKR